MVPIYSRLAAVCAVALAATTSLLGADQGAATTESDFAAVARPFLDKHCVRCHKDATAESNFLDLASPSSVQPSSVRPSEGAPDWGWLLDQVEFGDMPPAGEAAPTKEERAAFVHWLRSELGDGDAGEEQPLPARGLRRLTAYEYENAVLDVLGVTIDLKRRLPEDKVGHSFDHVASAQSLSEAHFTRYLEAAEAVAERAIPLALLEGAASKQRYFAESLTGGRGQGQGRLLWTNGKVETMSPAPCGGRYLIRAEVYGVQAGPDPCRAQLAIGDAVSEKTFDVPATSDAPEIIEAELLAEGGELTAGVRFVNDFYRKKTKDQEALDRNFVVRWIEVEGPLDGGRPTAFMERFGLGADSDATSEPLISQLAELLWRRPLASRGLPAMDDEIDPSVIVQLMQLSSPGESPAHRVRAALIGMLASPRFLFLAETQQKGAVRTERGSAAVDRHTLLSRLTSFLWRSLPDEGLWLWMRAGEPRTHGQIVARLLEDPRADRFTKSFADQWLQLRATESRRADRMAFPDFDERLRASMLEETRRVLIASLRERTNLWELIEGTETIVNRRLAEHYGLSAEAFSGEGRLPRRDEWLRASLDGTSRRGLLGHGSILFGTSEATRTSPVSRGRWVLDVLLGSAPPPPPPGADNLAPQEKNAEALSLRERMEAHRGDATCAACHARMDPIGFGLERFDAVGRERGDGGEHGLDLTGRLPDGRSFDGPIELAAILGQEDRFLEALAERLLVFALGRGLERADRAAVQHVVASLDPEHPTLEGMIVSVVGLEEFWGIAPNDVSDERDRENEDDE